MAKLTTAGFKTSSVPTPPLDAGATHSSITGNVALWAHAALAAVHLPGANAIVSKWTIENLTSKLLDPVTNVIYNKFKEVLRIMPNVRPELVPDIVLAYVVIMAHESKINPFAVYGYKNGPLDLKAANNQLGSRAKGLIQMIPGSFRDAASEFNKGKGVASLLQAAGVPDSVKTISPRGSEVMIGDKVEDKFDFTRPHGQIIPTLMYMTTAAQKLSNDWQFIDGKGWVLKYSPMDPNLYKKMDAIAPGIRNDKVLGIQLILTMMNGDGIGFYRTKNVTFHHVYPSTNRYLDDIKLFLFLRQKLNFDINSI